jgi:hypothetical protein
MVMTTLENLKIEVEGKIEASLAKGIALSAGDRAKIHELYATAHQHFANANKRSMSDPMGKGNAFPLGVGFTKMTRRKERNIDASVRRAGEAVVLFKKGNQLQEGAEKLLAGKGTEANLKTKAERRASMQRDLVKLLLGNAKGHKLGQFTIERVNKDRDGYPATFTFSGEGVIAGVLDKMDVVKDYFAGDKAAFRELVDRTKAEFEKSPA